MKNEPESKKIKLAFVSTYPLRECGIATFSRDLVENINNLFGQIFETLIIALNVGEVRGDYPKEVKYQISQNEISDYIKVAEDLNIDPDVKLICVQHEFGIFGNSLGQNLITFLQAVKKPVVIAFHTVLPNPTPAMKKIVDEIIQMVDLVIVMTETSKMLLERDYQMQNRNVVIIPHGIHPAYYSDGKIAKKKLNFDGKKILSTFGLLNRGKGIEYAILAMSEIIKVHPEVIYLVIGGTHPVVKKNEGEEYREYLKELTQKNNVSNNVLFLDKYFDTAELLELLDSTDIYLSLSQNPDQAVSGTLTYALGAGRAVISTPFAQAKEILTEDVGRLVSFGKSDKIRDQVLDLLSNEVHLNEMGKTAYFRTRHMTWDNVALAYIRQFSFLIPEISQRGKMLPPIKLEHIISMSDSFGIVQFARLHKPDFLSGYTTDDNARALVAMLWYLSKSREESQIVKKLASIYLSFLEFGELRNGGFANYFLRNGEGDSLISISERNNTENLDDSNSRAMWALGTALQSNMDDDFKKRARDLFLRQIDYILNIDSPRAVAFFIKAIYVSKLFVEDSKWKSVIKEKADFLLKLLNDRKDLDWCWFEEILTYSNAVMPEALIIASEILDDHKYFDGGKLALDFLIDKSFNGDVCVPVGQKGWFKKGESKPSFDQQPEEVSALVLALKTMYIKSNDEYYYKKMESAFDWFLGNNISNQFVYCHFSGGCFDGLGEKKINLNQGAESTVSFLLARLAIED